MKIVREKPCQRRHHRVTAPIEVTLPGAQPMTASNWSMGGLRLDGLASLPAVGAEMKLGLSLPFQGFDIAFEAKAKVVRTVRETGTVGFEFIDLEERASDLMMHFIDDLVRGQMATIEDTICRIDIPVTPISTKPDVNPAEAMPVNRIPVKTIVMSVLYAVLGIAVFSYVAILVFAGTMRIEVDSAVVSAPLATVRMPADGLLKPVNMVVDRIISEGEVIARIDNPKILEQLEDARIELVDARQDLSRAEEKLRLQTNRMQLYKVVKKTDMQIAQAQVDSAKAALEAADGKFARMAILLPKGLVEVGKYEDAKKERAAAEARLTETQNDLERASALSAVSDRVFFNNKEFVADLDMLALEVDAAGQRVKSSMLKIDKFEKALADLVIRAPFDGRIVSVQEQGNMTVLRETALFTVEKFDPPTVTAFLDQDQVLAIGMGDMVKVYLPSLGQHIPARVQKIDRSSAFIDSKASHYKWSDNKEKSAAVSLSIDLTTAERKLVTAGLPAVVIFPRRVTNEAFHNIGAAFTSIREMVRRDNTI